MTNAEIIMIPVADQQRAKEFYLRLGFEVILEAPMDNEPGQTWLQMGLPGSQTSFSLAQFQATIFETQGIEAEIRDLHSKNVAVGEIHETPWGRFAWFEDTDGNKLCLHQKN